MLKVKTLLEIMKSGYPDAGDNIPGSKVYTHFLTDVSSSECDKIKQQLLKIGAENIECEDGEEHSNKLNMYFTFKQNRYSPTEWNEGNFEKKYDRCRAEESYQEWLW